MATHEQKASTSSRTPIDPTTGSRPAPAKSMAPSTALKSKSEDVSKNSTTIHLGTRKSALAMIQAEAIHEALKKAHPEITYEIRGMSTMGDKNQTTALHDFGAKALWTYELEALLLDGTLDVIINCLKDMPTQLPEGCTIACITDQREARDAVVMKAGSSFKSISELPDGSIVGTSSVRRSSQIAMRYPRLKFKDVRGNVGTRLSKLDAEDGEYACLVLAAAGLQRMNLDHRITQLLDSKTPGGGMLHAVGQGALALEIRSGDEKMKQLLAPLMDKKAWFSGLAQRSLMRTLEGGCSVPIGVEVEWVEAGKLLIRAVVASLDGKHAVETERLGEVTSDKEADELGWEVAQDLVKKGADKILEAINLDRKVIKEGGGA